MNSVLPWLRQSIKIRATLKDKCKDKAKGDCFKMLTAENVEKDKIVETAENLKKEGYRLAAITGEKEGEILELVYHFDLNYEIKNIKVSLQDSDEEVESISHVYPHSFLIENEIQDLYGIKFNNLTIDYKGRLYMASNGPVAPLSGKKEE